MKKFFILALVAIALSSCKKEEFREVEVKVTDTVIVIQSDTVLRVDTIAPAECSMVDDGTYFLEGRGLNATLIVIGSQQLYFQYDSELIEVEYMLESGYYFNTSEINYIFSGEELYNLTRTPIDYIILNGVKYDLLEDSKYELYKAFNCLHQEGLEYDNN